MEDLDALLADLHTTTNRLTEKPQIHSNYSNRPLPQHPAAASPVNFQQEPQTHETSPEQLSSNLAEIDRLLGSLSYSEDEPLSREQPGRTSNNDYVSMHAVERSPSHMRDGSSSSTSPPHAYSYIPAAPRSGVTPAHTASRDLDKLMDTLSEFKLQEQKQQQKQLSPEEEDLDAVLGDLVSDMSAKGVDTSIKGACAACNKPIAGKMITAMGQPWHYEHFVCRECQAELGTQNFYEREGAPFCENCYQTAFAPKCAQCGGAVLDRCVMAMDRAWHPEHFYCAKCTRPFDEKSGFNEKEGKPYCSDCYHDSFGPRCFGCQKPITSNYLTALNATWHPECFVCSECGKDFSGGSFHQHEGRPYCEQHYHSVKGSLCAFCQGPITGRVMTAMGRKFHPEHFKCAFCTKELNRGTFKEHEEKPYCQDCFVKLFG